MTGNTEGTPEARQRMSWFEQVLFYPNAFVVACLVAMMLITSVDVFLRFCFDRPIVGVAEIIIPLMICAGFGGMAWCGWQDGHVKVDLLAQNLSRKARLVLRLLNYVVVAVLTAIMGTETIGEALAVRRIGVASDLLHIPEYPFYLVIAVCYLLLAVATAIMAVQTATGRRAV
ncbi:MAG: TRAP transporter small permease [Clostridia bacterium]|nr:TRAP transporter small permease [Clostridia bacterium]MDH7573703.1 TRAP transporter small permease [Clostridia bacterium]